MSSYLKQEILHTAFALVVTVVVAVAAQLVDIGSFEDVSLAGLAVTAIRSLATALITLGTRYLASRSPTS